MKGENVIVTGGAGFIGSMLAQKLLDEGNKVTVLDNLKTGNIGNMDKIKDNPNLRFEKTDLFNDEIDDMFSGADSVFHFSANPDVRADLKDTEKSFSQNILVTRNVLESMRKNGVRKLYFASSSTVYGEAETPTREDCSHLEPISIYGASKLSCEALISSYSHTFGISSLAFRFANVIGPGCHGVIYDFVRKLESNPNRLEILGDGRQKKSYIYLDDCIDAILVSAKRSERKFDVYNIGSEDHIEVDEIAKIVSKEMGLNPEFIYTGGRRGWKGDVPVMMLSIDKIKNIGWKPRYNSKDAVRMTVRDLIDKRA